MAILLIPFAFLIRSLRWRYLLKHIKTVTKLNALSATVIGAMGDMIIPRMGDFVRAYVMGKKEEVSKVASLATIVVERALDTLCILIILLLILAFSGFPVESTPSLAQSLKMGSYSLSLLCLVLIGFLLLLRFRPAQIIRLIKASLGFLPEKWLERIIRILESFIFGLQGIQKGWHLLYVILLSALLWNMYALVNFLILRSFGLNLPFSAGFYFILFQVLGLAIPSSPGFVGTYHAAVVAGFAIFEVSQELAVSVAIIMHAVIISSSLSFGFMFLWKEGLSFREIWSTRTERS
jgi:uncharacterized protein (TIRG00374 family)